MGGGPCFVNSTHDNCGRGRVQIRADRSSQGYGGFASTKMIKNVFGILLGPKMKPLVDFSHPQVHHVWPFWAFHCVDEFCEARALRSIAHGMRHGILVQLVALIFLSRWAIVLRQTVEGLHRFSPVGTGDGRCQCHDGWKGPFCSVESGGASVMWRVESPPWRFVNTLGMIPEWKG